MSEFLEASSADDIGEREYITRNRKDQNIGYREGNFQGRSDALQKAFDASYRMHASLAVIRTLITVCVKASDTENKGHLEDLLHRMDQELSDVSILQEYENDLTNALKLCIVSLHNRSMVISEPEVIRNKFPALNELLDLLIRDRHYQ